MDALLVLLLGILVVMAMWGKPWLIVLVLFLLVLFSAQGTPPLALAEGGKPGAEEDADAEAEEDADADAEADAEAEDDGERKTKAPAFIGPAGAPVEPVGGGAPPPLSAQSCDGGVAPAGGSAGFSAVDYAKASPAQSAMNVPLYAQVDAKPSYQQDLMDAAMAVSVTNLPLPSGKSIKEFAYFCNNDVCHHKDRYMVENKSAAPSHERAPPLAGPAGERHR